MDDRVLPIRPVEHIIYTVESPPNTGVYTQPRGDYMKTRLMFAVALILAVGAVWAAEAPTVDLLTYPGGEATMEISLSNEDILPTMKAMLPMMGSSISAITEKVSVEEIASIFRDVRRIQFMTIEVAKAGVAETDIANYYAKNLPAGQWNRVFWQAKGNSGTVSVYSQANAETLYGFRVRSAKEEGKTVRRIEVIKTEGKLDFAKLMKLAGAYFDTAKAEK